MVTIKILIWKKLLRKKGCNVINKQCGYLGTQFWNQGRTQEIKERVCHGDNKDYDIEKAVKEEKEV